MSREECLPLEIWSIGFCSVSRTLLLLTTTKIQINQCRCIPGEGETEAKLIEAIEKYLGVAFHVLKLVPAILAVAAFTRVSAPIMQAADANCADSGDTSTEKTFDKLDDEVEITNDALISQITGDCFSIFVAIIMALYEHMKGAGDAEGEGEGEDGDKTAEMTEGNFEKFKDEEAE